MTYCNYHLVLKQTSGLCTPLQADTIWGHFTSYLAQKDNALLERYIQTYRDKIPAVIFSDGLPSIINKDKPIEWCLPKPADAPLRLSDNTNQKSIKKAQWLSAADLKNIESGNDFELKPIIEIVPHTSMYNQVSRTGQEDTKLYPLPETWLKPTDQISTAAWSIFVRVRTDMQDPLKPFLENFLRLGYGKKKNIGKGQFEILSLSEHHHDSPESCNAFMSLSTYVPAQHDPTDGYWQTLTKYGKMGESAIFLDDHIADNPFKSPIVMLKADAVFKVNEGQIKEYYGVCNLNENQAIRQEETYIHPTLAFVIPYRMKEE